MFRLALKNTCLIQHCPIALSTETEMKPVFFCLTCRPPKEMNLVLQWIGPAASNMNFH